MTVGLAIITTTVILAVTLATRQPVTPLTFLAYPALFGVTYVFYVGRRLTGWSRLWSRQSSQVSPDRTHIDFQLRFKGNPFLMPLLRDSEITCLVRNPAGQEARITNVYALGGKAGSTSPMRLHRSRRL
jgi:hypothetical protein